MSAVMNSGSTGVNQASQDSASIPEPDCKELNSRNTKQRRALARDQSKSISSVFKRGGASTVAHGSLNGGAPIGAASRLLPLRYKRLAQGLWANTTRAQRRKMRKTGRSNVCPDNPFQYEQAMRPHQSHCESKILETLFSKATPPSGTLLLNINWQSLADVNSKVPCPACKRLLCHAQEHCGINVYLCRKDENAPPRKLKC